MRRRNSGDEEIRKLLRDLNENPTSAIAERLAAALRRREELDPRPEFSCPNCSERRTEPEGACVLEALAEVVASRLLDDEDIKLDDGEIYNRVMKWLSEQSATGLWESIGLVVDDWERSFRESDPATEGRVARTLGDVSRARGLAPGVIDTVSEAFNAVGRAGVPSDNGSYSLEDLDRVTVRAAVSALNEVLAYPATPREVHGFGGLTEEFESAAREALNWLDEEDEDSE